MKISSVGIQFIKQFEGFRSVAYQDQVGIWTIGYGSTTYRNGLKPKKGDVLSVVDAIALLEYDINIKASNISYLIKAILSQNQVDAILSLVYNIGAGAFAKSTLLKMINQNSNDQDIKACWMSWNKATKDGKLITLSGLTLRREMETELYFKP